MICRLKKQQYRYKRCLLFFVSALLGVSLCACTIIDAEKDPSVTPSGSADLSATLTGMNTPELDAAPASATCEPGTLEDVHLLPQYRLLPQLQYGATSERTFLISPSLLISSSTDQVWGRLPYVAWRDSDRNLYTMLFLYGPAEAIPLRNGQDSFCFRMVELQVSASQLTDFMQGESCDVDFIKGTYFYAQDFTYFSTALYNIPNSHSLQPQIHEVEDADLYMGWIEYTEEEDPYLVTFAVASAENTGYQDIMQIIGKWQTRYWPDESGSE